MKEWYNLGKLDGKNYVCGYCGKAIMSNIGFYTKDNSEKVYICHNCNGATFFNWKNEQTPGYLYGKEFNVKIPEDIKELYNEIRRCYSVKAYSAVSMGCRKLLMHIAVQCGARENLKFIEYVDYLDEQNYIPKNSKKWVDIIRNKGNETNHEIKISNEKDAQQLIKFVEIIITLIYEIELEIEE